MNRRPACFDQILTAANQKRQRLFRIEADSLGCTREKAFEIFAGTDLYRDRHLDHCGTSAHTKNGTPASKLPVTFTVPSGAMRASAGRLSAIVTSPRSCS